MLVRDLLEPEEIQLSAQPFASCFEGSLELSRDR
jgi:hypothetical protein